MSVCFLLQILAHVMKSNVVIFTITFSINPFIKRQLQKKYMPEIEMLQVLHPR